MTLAHPFVRRQDLSPSESPSPPTTSAYISHTYLNPDLDKTIYSTPISSELDLNYYTAPITTDIYCIDSRESTPSDSFSWGLSDAQFMQDNPPQYPQVRLHQSTPKNGLPSAQSPPPMVDGQDFVQPSWNSFSQDTSYLAPTAQQQYIDQSSYRSHKRLSSSSSIGSAGPDSPFTQSPTYPQIVDPDSPSVQSAHLDSYDGSYANAGQYSKPTFPSPLSQTSDQSFYPTFQNFNLQGNNAVSMMGAQTAMGNQQHAPGMNRRQSSPRGPYGGEADASSEVRSNIPQFERTESDMCQDELYNPATQAPALPAHARPQVATSGNLLSPHRSKFSSLLQQANNGHLSARSASPVTQTTSRQFSPFRNDSRYNTAGPGFSNSNPSSPATRLNSAAQIREQQNLDEAQAYAQHHQRSRHDLLNPPNTISPKEALLDYTESDEGPNPPLFPSPQRESQPLAGAYDRRRINTAKNSTEQSFTSMATSRRESSSNYSASSSSAPQHSTPNIQFMPPSVPGMPQQYPFISQSRRQSSSMRSGGSDQVPEFPASLTSMESTRSESAQDENVRLIPEASQRSAPSSQEGPTQRPADTSAGHGTYTCTTPDCHGRFETSARLQKHRKEAHRQQSPFAAAASPKTSSTASAPHNPQAAQNNVSRNNAPGPHKCEKTNPSTGKPCNTVFSRSYDLTRHEDTIHNNRKQKVRCHLCTEEKTFSRNDALTRHMRVVHPDVDFPGKTRRGRNSEGADVVRQRIESGRGGR